MTLSISPALREQIYIRAQKKCEYCLINRDVSAFSHEVDHIIARKHRGLTNADNLALSCFACNRHKGSDLASFDPLTNELTLLFNPRTQIWDEHFQLAEGYIIGKTAIGRTTVFLFNMNTADQVYKRQVLIAQDLYP
jgi:hypothetical protein